MSFTGARTGGVDLLTQTTLQLDPATPAAAISELVRILRGVPGVLLVESNGASACAVVAHDAGVATTSLVAAAHRAGVRARIARSPIAISDQTGAAATQSPAVPNRARLAMVAFGVLLLVDEVVPSDKRWIVSLLIASLGFSIFIEALKGRRRT
jgi:hypothetical protein